MATKPQRFAEGSDNDSRRIGFIKNLYEKYLTYWQPDLERAIINARMYWHIDFGQWPKEVVDKLMSEGRRPPTMPVIPDKIETLVGSIISNGYDVSFQPAFADQDDMALKLQDMYYSDSALLSWEEAEREALLNSCIYAGFERMKIDYDLNPYGHIGWESLNPRHILLDPAWKTNNVNDLKNYIVFNDLLPTQIIDLYPEAAEKLMLQMDMDKSGDSDRRVDFGPNHGAVPEGRDWEKKWGSYHRVIEFHSIVKRTGFHEWDKKNGCFFPDSGYKDGSNEDKISKLGYVQKLGLGVDDIAMVPRTWNEAKIESIVPTLSSTVFLTSGLDPIQTGNVNLYPLGLRYNGQFQGVVVDRLYDIQIAINRGEMNRQDIMTRSAKGAFILDEALTGGDEDKKALIEQNWNDPAARLWVDEGTTKSLGPNAGIISLPTSNVSFDQINAMGSYYDMADRFSKVPASMDARQESSKESGKLYRYKYEAGQITQKFYLKIVEQHKRDKAEAYYNQAKIQYSTGTRVFTGTKNGKPVLINTTNYDKFDLAEMPRLKISVIPSPKGISTRTELQNMFGELLPMLVGPNDGLMRTIAMGKIISNAEMTDKDHEEFNKAIELTTQANAFDLLAKLKQAQGMAMQAQMQMQPQEPSMQALPTEANPTQPAPESAQEVI